MKLSRYELVLLEAGHVDGAVRLQHGCFPPPFPQDLLWKPEHLSRHLQVFPAGQWAVLSEGHVVASSTSVLISEELYQAHLPWEETVGGHFLEGHDPAGTTLYGVDISVHPDHRGKGLARQLYEARFAYVRENRLARFATACRLPGLAGWLHGRRASKNLLEQYLGLVESGVLSDRTLTPLLKLSTTLVGGAMDYMDDEESCNCSALLEWSP